MMRLLIGIEMPTIHPIAAALLHELGYDPEIDAVTVQVLRAARRAGPRVEGPGLRRRVEAWVAEGAPFFVGDAPESPPQPPVHPTLRHLIALLKELDEQGVMEDCYFEPHILSDDEEEPLKEAVLAWRGAGYPSPLEETPSETPVEDRLHLLLEDEDG